MTISIIRSDIRKYLPEGVFLANAGDAIQTVTVYIERETSKKLEIRAEKVKITKNGHLFLLLS